MLCAHVNQNDIFKWTKSLLSPCTEQEVRIVNQLFNCSWNAIFSKLKLSQSFRSDCELCSGILIKISNYVTNNEKDYKIPWNVECVRVIKMIKMLDFYWFLRLYIMPPFIFYLIDRIREFILVLSFTYILGAFAEFVMSNMYVLI